MDTAGMNDGMMGFGMGDFGMLLAVTLVVLAAAVLVKFMAK